MYVYPFSSADKTDNSFLYQWLKNQKFPTWKHITEGKPVSDQISEPKPKPYIPYIPKVVPKNTHGHTHTFTQSRVDHHGLPPRFGQFPYGFKPFPINGFPSRFQIPPFPYPPIRPVYRIPFPPVFGYPFYQKQKEEKGGKDQHQVNFPPRYPVFPPTIGTGRVVPGPILPPFQPPVFPPFGGLPYAQPNQGKFGGPVTNVYNSVGNGNGVFGNRLVTPGSYGFGGILNSIKGSSSTPFLPKPYPFVPLQPKYGYPPVIFNYN